MNKAEVELYPMTIIDIKRYSNIIKFMSKWGLSSKDLFSLLVKELLIKYSLNCDATPLSLRYPLHTTFVYNQLIRSS